MSQKRVAIVGAGVSGLMAAKYSLENGLQPVVFEKASEIGGLWTANGTAIWEGLTTNVTRYVQTISDHPWPEESRIYPTAKQVCEYYRSYAKRFDLERHVRLRHHVENVARSSDLHSWNIRYKNLATDQIETETFDFFMIASGIFTNPRIPQYENANAFKGIIKHSSQFKLNDPELKSKNIVVVGGCISAVDLTAILAKHAKSVTHVFRRKVGVVSRLWYEKVAEPNLYSIQPLEFFTNKRSFAYADESLTKAKIPNMSDFKKLFPYQTNPNSSCPEALRIDFDKPSEELILALSDSYIDSLRDGKIRPIHSEIERYDENGVFLKNGDYLKTDCVIYSTGYNVALNYLNPEVFQAFKFRADKPKFEYLLYKNTFVPGWETMAFIGNYALLSCSEFEMQVRWATAVFSGKIKLPDRPVMDEYLRELEEKRNNSRSAQFPYGPSFKIVDEIARELDLLPNLNAIKETNPEVFEYLWNDIIVSAHYLFDKQDKDYFIKMLREIKGIKTRVYEIDKKEEDIRQADIEEQFTKFYKY